jgi:ferredoxin-NADP reductase
VARAALLERLIPPAPLDWRVATVQDVTTETEHARSFVLDIPGWDRHRAGQYLDVRLTAPDGYQAQRSFSISSPPEARLVEITVERVMDGEVSPYLVDQLAVGDELELRGPIGKPFSWSVDDGGPLLVIGGGSGFVPLMAMLRHRAARGSAVETKALVSVRSPADLLYSTELPKLSTDPAVDLRMTYTRMSPPDWPGWTGRVNAAMLAELGPPPEAAPHTFICGPTGFVETVANLLVDAGHNPLKIRTERFGPT